MALLLGLIALGVEVWGIIAFWGTSWSITSLVLLGISVLRSTFAAGAEIATKENNNLPEEKPTESVFTSFFKKDK